MIVKEENINNTPVDEEAASTSSFKSSAKNALKNVGGVGSSLLNNKYQSIKNNKLNNNNNNNIPSKNPMPLGNRPNMVGNKLANKISNLHPALKAINTIRNIKRGIGGIGGGLASSVSNKDSSVNESNNDNISSVPSDNSTSSTIEADTSSKIGSPLGGVMNFLGGISIFGKVSLPLKFAIMFGGPLIFVLFIMLVVSLPIMYFSGFFGMDDVSANSSGTVSDIAYGDYELSSDGDEILHESLSSFLESKGSSIEEFNNLISSNVDAASYGTRAGVVASAVTLIAELGNNYDVKIPYYWGGGHGNMIDGADSSWGSSSCKAVANGKIYDHCGLDCSGFVAWAIWNGGFNISARTAGSFQNLPGAKHVSLTSSAVLQPGDLLESSSHVILVVGIDEEAGEYICAEASGLESGVLFSRKAFNNSYYWGVDMEGFYNREGQVRS